MRYIDIIQKLFQLNQGKRVKLSLEMMKRLDKTFGHPSQQIPAVHIAGTNGKGSVSVKVAKALELSGKKVGLYTSPHISTFRERIRIGERLIDEETVARLLGPLLEKKSAASFFELTTLLMFLWFKEEGVDVAVLETGLGGRLDATNICRPIITCITSVAFDHTHILGNTLEAIAREKGGIRKEGVPMVLGPRVPETLHGIRVFGTFKTYEDENRAIARAVLEELEIDEQAIVQGLEASLPCRFEHVSFRGSTFILDVGHNPDGLEKFFDRLPTKLEACIFGISKDKDVAACLKILAAGCSHFYLVEADNERAAKRQDLKDGLLRLGIKNEAITLCSSIAEAVRLAAERASRIAILGTFFIMREARAALGICEPQDPLPLIERI